MRPLGSKRRRSKKKSKRKSVKMAIKIKGSPTQVKTAMKKMVGETAGDVLSGRM